MNCVISTYMHYINIQQILMTLNWEISSFDNCNWAVLQPKPNENEKINEYMIKLKLSKETCSVFHIIQYPMVVKIIFAIIIILSIPM